MAGRDRYGSRKLRNYQIRTLRRMKFLPCSSYLNPPLLDAKCKRKASEGPASGSVEKKQNIRDGDCDVIAWGGVGGFQFHLFWAARGQAFNMADRPCYALLYGALVTKVTSSTWAAAALFSLPLLILPSAIDATSSESRLAVL